MKKLLIILGLFGLILAPTIGQLQVPAIASSIQVAAGAVYTDDFQSYSIGALVGNGQWILGSGTIQIGDVAGDKRVYSNTNVSRTAAIYNDVFEDDQYSEAVVDGMNTGAQIGIGVRLAGSEGTLDGYWYFGNSNQSALRRIDNGVLTTLGSTGNGFTATDVIKITIEGDAIKCYKNGVLDTEVATNGEYTDATYSSGKAGIVGYDDHAGITLDEWEGGDL